MLGSILKKVFFKKSPKVAEPKPTLVTSLNEKSKLLSSALSEKYDEVKNELFSMRDKFGNLLETNYNLGLTHLENGNLSDATFRFRFIKKFWPQHYDSHFQLAYCLLLSKKTAEAKKVLLELLAKDPGHQNAKDLLVFINSTANPTANADQKDV